MSTEKPNHSEGSDENLRKNSDDPRDWGYHLFPERKGKLSYSLGGLFSGREGTEEIQRIKCEKLVYDCYKTSHLVKLMTSALKASGCGIDLSRHIVCEVCNPEVTGGYDPETNQIVICQNNVNSKGVVQGILTHEMIHMFDFCKNKVDFKNLDHLACTEVRAANLTHCGFLSAFLAGNLSLLNVQAKHQECVREKAVTSIIAVRNVTLEEARAAVERVFKRCYADLEPIGRRIKPNSEDQKRAYTEGFLYGYID